MPKQTKNPYDTAITVRIKRYDQTYFILCDEYEPVDTLRGRFLNILLQQGFKMPKQEEELVPEDLRFTIKNRILDMESSCHDQ